MPPLSHRKICCLWHCKSPVFNELFKSTTVAIVDFYLLHGKKINFIQKHLYKELEIHYATYGSQLRCQ